MKKTRKEGVTEKVKLKMIECSTCGGGYVLYDSRDNNRNKLMSREEKAETINRNQERQQLDGQPCKCGKGVYKLIHNKWTEFHKGYTIVTCYCRKKVDCLQFTNTCTCGRDYNWNGDLLANRSQWGEETGEQWSECY
jgi:hypothetical protein